MHADLDPKAWVKQLELTAPIKSLMGFVDELAANYDQRVASLKLEFKADVEEVVECYKKEKQAMQSLLESKESAIIEQKLIIAEKETKISALQQDLIAIKQVYKLERVEHEISIDALNEARSEIITLSAALKNEQELISITQERIRTANEQLKIELENKNKDTHDKRSSLTKTRDFIVQIFKKADKIEATFDEPVKKENISY